MDLHGEMKVSELENEKADQQLSRILQLSSDINTVVEDQMSLISYWIAKIKDDFDVIDYFFSNPYKYSATPMLKAQFYKDAEACKEDSSECYSTKDSSVYSLQGNSSDSWVTCDDSSDGSEYDFDSDHDDIMFHASRSQTATPNKSILNVANKKCECDRSTKVHCLPDEESWVAFDFDYFENLHAVIIESPIPYDDIGDGSKYLFDPYLDDMIYYASRSQGGGSKTGVSNKKTCECDISVEDNASSVCFI